MPCSARPLVLSAIETSAVDFPADSSNGATGRVKEKFEAGRHVNHQEAQLAVFIHVGRFRRGTCLNFWRASRFSHGRSQNRPRLLTLPDFEHEIVFTQARRVAEAARAKRALPCRREKTTTKRFEKMQEGILTALVGAAVGGLAPHAASAATLDDVKGQRLRPVRVNTGLAGFAAPDASGN